MKNIMIALLTAYAYTTICVPAEKPIMVAQALLIFWLTKAVLNEADRIGRKKWKKYWQ